ncbi:hypothetical protein GYMLUDRAFT_48276 [Collybiopsis luxurians FD-317 M1]|uniref:Transmembrane protein n=1 Tax=Collybiopsis luxurians FD-317 M1 TaxID=944289 RepID=A0A0D0CA49_9AGAR|nr:hypothetical protein GYMLUDRAFT_48276 [Collybiopsis luxurians FD-317 M1]
MVNWKSATEVSVDQRAFSNLMHALLGLYVWEWFTSLDFDWSYIGGKRRFRWPLIIYFLNRYCLLFALIGIAISLNVTTEINCQVLYTFNSCFGNAAIGLSSITFSLRTMAVWEQKLYIVIPLVLVILGHWSLLLHGILVKAAYDPALPGCAITKTDNTLLAVTFIYTMCFDFVVLSLIAWKLVIKAPSSKTVGQSKLVVLIFGDGLIYFIIAFLANLLATVFMILNLNAVMSIVANVPAAIASTTVACRAVRRFAKFASLGPEMFAGTDVSMRTTAKSTVQRPRLDTSMKSEGVHVQMEVLESPSTARTYVNPEFDTMGNIMAKGSPQDGFEDDLEAQKIHNEFKRLPY